ncbi:hypothetical protein ACQPZX_41330 [Actinoplanes sp. CA-142083]|uniref:hypothetical protein n=1 Tax=Actinoplanes sp. CA-142083 TaxID=3239903 RepID=UPI003D92F6B9
MLGDYDAVVARLEGAQGRAVALHHSGMPWAKAKKGAEAELARARKDVRKLRAEADAETRGRRR